MVLDLTGQPEECNFADDTAGLSHTQNGMQDQLDKVDQTTRSVSHKIHFNKTKVRKVRNKSLKKINVQVAEILAVTSEPTVTSTQRPSSNRTGFAAQTLNGLQNKWKSPV